MSSETFSARPEPKLSPAVGSLGDTLKAGRDRANLSQSEVASQLHLPLAVIKGLEEDDYAGLPEPAYVRGYLRNYARLVGLDAQQQVERYNAREPTGPAVALPTGNPTSHPRLPRAWIGGMVVVALALGVSAAGWLYGVPDPSVLISAGDREPQPMPPAEEASPPVQRIAKGGVKSRGRRAEGGRSMPVQAQTDTDQGDHDRPDSDQPAAAPSSAPDVLQSAHKASASAHRALAAGAQPESAGSAAASGDRLTLSYSKDSWTEIRDAHDKLLLQDLIDAGATRKLRGDAPFEVFLGNAPGVEVSINGNTFDQSNFTRSNDTARFSVSPPGGP